ncbi:hypothetical protein GmHk_04G011246 [Glycine max]|nr:hypothetical protein GmHk_04G011246 [Glycine max]
MAMTFSAGFAYLEAERVNNIVWALERFRGLFLRNDRLPIVIVTDRDLTLMNAVKNVFPEYTNLLCRVESAHWALKRLLQNSLGDLCSVWDAMKNMITLQHVEIKASFESNTHVVGHLFKKTLYKRLLGMVSRDALNQIASEVDRLRYLGNNPSSRGCVMRSTHGLPCACEFSRYTAGSIPVESIHIFWRRLCLSDQGLCEAEVSIKEEIKTISKRFDELDVSGKVNMKSKLREIAYPDHNSICPPPSKVNTKVTLQSNVVHHVLNRLSQQGSSRCWINLCHSFKVSFVTWSHEYMNLFCDTERFEQLKLSLLVDGFSKVSVDKWMDITEMGYVIASRQPPLDSSGHRMICVSHVFGNHFVQIYLKDHCPLPPPALLWSNNCYSLTKQWATPYISRMQQYTSLMSFKRHYVDLNED